MIHSILGLAQNSSYGKVARITHDLKGKILVRWLDDGCINECLLESVKGCVALFIKNEGGLLGKVVGERSGYMREVFDEMSIEPGMPKETTNTLNIRGRWELLYDFYLSLIHLYPMLKHSMS